MNQALIEKHEDLVIEIANVYLDNMALELGKMYQKNTDEISAGLSNDQNTELKAKHNISDNEFADIYSEFQKMKPTDHQQKALDAFTASGGKVDIEPNYDENTRRLNVSINFIIKDKIFKKIEGLTPLENVILKRNAMLQVETLLSGSNSDISAAF